MNITTYKIEALTNMHVGSGDTNYGVIDNLVQRDVTTGLPTINGSSIKGALKEFFENRNIPDLKEFFGSNDNNADFKFLSAKLLAIPLRSNKKNYFLATAPMIIKQLKQDAKLFGFTDNTAAFDKLAPETGRPIVFTDPTGLIVENFDNFQQENNQGETIFGDIENLIFLHDDDFKEMTDDFNLPVIARNKVGENKNLWYEQVVPSHSLFYFTVIGNKNNPDIFISSFEDNIVHIGANATVGYGFTKISKIQ